MSLTSIEAHQQKWSELPLFTTERWVVTDADIEAWSDLIHMREVLDAIEDLSPTPVSIHDLLGGGEREGRGQIEFDIDIYLDPWPNDIAGQLIDSWKAAA